MPVGSMPWHGRSLPPDGWWKEEYKLTRDFYVEFVVAFCRALGLEKAILMGCSMGGYVMFEIARDYPNDFTAFISLQGRDYEPTWQGLSKWYVHPEVNANVLVRPLIASLIPATAPEARRREIGWIYMRCAPGVLPGDFYFAAVDHDRARSPRSTRQSRHPVPPGSPRELSPWRTGYRRPSPALTPGRALAMRRPSAPQAQPSSPSRRTGKLRSGRIPEVRCPSVSGLVRSLCSRGPPDRSCGAAKDGRAASPLARRHGSRRIRPSLWISLRMESSSPRPQRVLVSIHICGPICRRRP
jgi:pimeloyl-ACP methyl ester carboxylesterase